MKNSRTLTGSQRPCIRKSSHSALGSFTAGAVLLLLLSWHLAVNAQGVQTDNFDGYSGTISPPAGPSAGPGGWTVISGGGSTITFPAVGSGKGVRLRNAPGSLTSFLRATVYTDFYIASDVVDWAPDIDQAVVLTG